VRLCVQREAGLLESTIEGNTLRQRCLEYRRRAGLEWACTSDAREMLELDSRARYIERAPGIVAGVRGA
jgi:hypothetical protein